MRALLYLTTYSGAYSVHRSVNGAGLFGIAFRYVAVRSKALPCILKQNMESWSFPFINDEARPPVHRSVFVNITVVRRSLQTTSELKSGLCLEN